MSKDLSTYKSKDPAATLVKTQVLNDGPIGVPDLEIAAAMLDVPMVEIRRAAKRVRPWIHYDGATRFWSVRQLARAVVHDRANPPRPGPAKGRKLGPHDHRNGKLGPILDREKALAAAELATTIGTAMAAERYKVTPVTLNRAWRRYGIKPKVPTGGNAAKRRRAATLGEAAA
jgi:hypothetical protein